MARPFIELYINNQLVEFDEPPRVLITYAHNELHNPTIIKNSYSKTLEIAGTPNNNKIFNAFYDMRWVNGAGFNPSKKMPFELYRNGEIMEQGYVKLDSVKRTNNNISYSITLYGGLGQFLYNLTTKEDGEEMKLRDLIYPYNLDFEVNKSTVRAAWQHINGINTSDAVYDFINFAPCYNGIPKDFTANKVAINAEMFNMGYKDGLTLSKDDYTTVNGWIMGELQGNLDEWQTKDLRSYLQRPVIRVKEIIKACCDPQNNGGYEVELDNDFFNDDNKYWNDAWMTLPLLTEMKSDETSVTPKLVWGDDNKILIQDYSEDYKMDFSVPFSMMTTVPNYINTEDVDELYTGVQITLNPSKKDRDKAQSYNACKYAQLVVYDMNDNVVNGSTILSFYTNILNAVNFTYEPEYDTTVESVFGAYNKIGESKLYEYSTDFAFNNGGLYTFKFHNLTWKEGYYIKLVVKNAEIRNYEPFWYRPDVPEEEKMENNLGMDWLYKKNEYHSWKDTVKYVFWAANIETIDVMVETTVLKNNILKFNTVLNSEHTPADYFLSYLKMFNLHIWKDMYENKIYVSKRNNFFTNEFYDLEDVIDRGEEMHITPLTFDAKWYNFKLDMETSGALYKDYKNEYGIEYGIQKVDTNYNFDNSSKNLFENNVYKGCIMQRGKSRYYIDLFDSKYSGSGLPLPSYVQDGIQTFLYNTSGDTTEGTYITPMNTLGGCFWGYGRNYDITPKPSFVDAKNEPIDGANCLLFFDGYREMKDENGSYIRYFLTDDIPEFEILNEGEPCWIWTSSYEDVSGNDIAYIVRHLPIFSRYATNNNSWVIHSWDFGTPKATYIPDYNIDETSSIYSQYWKPYIQDMYSVNTRTVDCKVLLKERVIGDWLRRWYYFDGTYWMLNEITDYDVTSNDTTKCTFVRINNTDNYLI